jgi:hypothetical protein
MVVYHNGDQYRRKVPSVGQLYDTLYVVYNFDKINWVLTHVSTFLSRSIMSASLRRQENIGVRLGNFRDC